MRGDCWFPDEDEVRSCAVEVVKAIELAYDGRWEVLFFPANGATILWRESDGIRPPTRFSLGDKKFYERTYRSPEVEEIVQELNWRIKGWREHYELYFKRREND